MKRRQLFVYSRFMKKLIARSAAVLLATTLALTTTACQQQEKPKSGGKDVEVQIDAGKAKVKVDGKKTSDEHGGHIDVEIQNNQKPGKAPSDRPQ